MAELKKLVARRKTIRTRVTISHNSCGTFDSLTNTQRAVERANLSDYKTDLLRLDESIHHLKYCDSECIDDREMESEMDACEEYRSKIQQCVVTLDSLKTINAPSNNDRLEEARSLLKQPVAPLPKFFSNDNDDLLKFLKEFEMTTASYKYPDRDLLLLLLQQVSGNAKTLLNSLEADKQTYRDAKELLITAFASPENRKFDTIRKLTDLELGYDDDPFEFFSKVKMVHESVKSLTLEVDDIIQYFVWNGLNNSFRTHLVNVTGKNKPSINEIMDSFFIANERYAQTQKLHKARKSVSPSSKGKKQSSSSFAADIGIKCSNNLKGCSLCSKSDGKAHPIFRCQKFKTPKAKLEEIGRLNGCTKCGNLNHSSALCKFKFRRKCDNCLKWHFRFLCPQWSTGSQNFANDCAGITSKSAEASSAVVVLQSLSCDSVLPTFSFFVNNFTYRALSDRGSQSSFVSRKLAESQQLRVLQNNVKLTINGFNKPQFYQSRLVEVPIKLGERLFKIPSLIVPEIKIHLELPKLGRVVQSFKRKGFLMADSFLDNDSKSICNIDFILGSDATSCLAGNDVCFGSNSLYINSPVGVLLVGNVNRLMADISFLPQCGSLNPNNCGTSLALTEIVNSASNVDHIFESHAFLISDFVQPLDNEELGNLDYVSAVTQSNVCVLDDKGKLIDAKLQQATDQILEEECCKYTHYDSQIYNDETVELHDTVIDYTLKNLSQDADGRIIVPLLWNRKVSNYLSKNQHLSKQILHSSLVKLKKNGHLQLMDQTIKDQVKDGIIAKVENASEYLAEHPEYSFLPHMGIFKPERETTKCRIVFLSNLWERDRSKKLNLSHNQAMFAGPSLNQKLSSAFLQLRFGSYLLLYDLKKAFNQLLLSDSDQSKLLFYWYRNVNKGDFSLVVYRNVRLSFGLRCSPFLLMIALYYILVLESKHDSIKLQNLKHLMYGLLYMDNGAITVDSKEDLKWSYNQLEQIFLPFHFEVQQLYVNDVGLQSELNKKFGEDSTDEVKLLGLMWNRINDTICTKPVSLNIDANTKRTILKSLASQFDVFNFNMPILNRSRLFMHMLQCDKSLGWDTQLPSDSQREWRNICKQVNSTPSIKISRFVGPRDGKYELCAFTDASHLLYGCVVYIKHIDTGKLSFVAAKNRMVNLQLKRKSIPSLELNAITLGVETLMEIYRDLSGPTCIKPINTVKLNLFTDSICCLHWLHLAVNKMDKMQKRTAFVLNRLQSIQKLCALVPVTFGFIPGINNPADCVTRCLSYKQLMKSNFLTGPDIDRHIFRSDQDLVEVTIPSPLVERPISEILDSTSSSSKTIPLASLSTGLQVSEFLLNPSHFSSFRRMVLLHRRVLYYFQLWKAKANLKCESRSNLFADAACQIIKMDQRKHFSDVLQYFERPKGALCDIPPIVSQLNVHLDQKGLLRVKCKFKKWHINSNQEFPILIPKNSALTHIIIMDAHIQLAHSGCYSVLAELRKHFYIPHHFSTVKKCLQKCVHCKRFNARTIKLNQGKYREFRAQPPQTPFANVFLDHLGPFLVKKNKQNEKIWLLCITCTWSRAINLKICHDLSLKEFLRAFQMHCYEFGVPQLCVSDLGSQFTAGFNLLTDFLQDPEVQTYFECNNVKPLSFQQYFKGCSELGSLVETCVKLVKRLIFGSIKNNILDYYEFEFLVCYIIHLVNRRPIAFKEALRDTNADSVPEPITPEHLIRGYELTSLNLIPDLQGIPSDDPEYKPNINPSTSIQDQYNKLRKVRSEIIEKYQDEFLGTLISQAVDRKGRYHPVTHHIIHENDIVLLKETNTKPNYYPLAIVKQVVKNDNDEVTGAVVLKGRTREVVKRHSSTLIPLLRVNSDHSNDLNDPKEESTKARLLPSRKAAKLSKQKTKKMFDDDLA